ncbi:uncharacterized protein LOC113656605 isoform X1 [Tachysurus fulvidraco]|uniref:uncharacterized protein LOC113656605 isoform X1 n=1 Tax=Tachysurus fulvidraco TaxID=1234273 RepID=UPI001FEF458E|nr:uncharacterized protein LOC113656605 isoform X1 [Tachysurus fulvidraco]XP_047675916.1 uncharacterized protein LOC113656605 isoform X1 [Tachysurus fulvidraco]XP_047675917.1 uncharacterized protein LOC113656605 isoform X1 [Tachysurus fulvidraco]XP_047675919.1 uncharacterized protein LOC113656605 isoform X1 [Tachysurus fulvidraco]
MSLLYISILWVCACVDSAESLVTVSAQVGSTVILPCKLTEEFKPTSVIRWQFNKDIVFERSSNGTYSGSGYEGRVDVPVDELRKGNCSLVLKNIRVNDTGIYNSGTMVHVDNNTAERKEINSVRLSVYGLQISAPVGSTVVLPCDWSHLSIKTPHVKWFIDSETVFERKGKDVNQSQGYKDRVDVPEDELLKGNCSLVMKNISVYDAGIYSSSMMNDTEVLVQKVELSVEMNWIILYVGIIIIIIIIFIIFVCVSVYYSRVKALRCASNSTEKVESLQKHGNPPCLLWVTVILKDGNRHHHSVQYNTTSDSVTYTTVNTQPQS